MPERIANIGPVGANRRRQLGYVWAIVALVAVCAMQIEAAPRSFTLLLAIPIALAGVGFFQASEMTCVALCALGRREPSAGDPALSADELPVVKRQATRVIVKSLVASAVLTTLIFLAWNG